MMHCLTAHNLNLTSLSRTLLAGAHKPKEENQIEPFVRGVETQNKVDYVSQARSRNKQPTNNQPKTKDS